MATTAREVLESTRYLIQMRKEAMKAASVATDSFKGFPDAGKEEAVSEESKKTQIPADDKTMGPPSTRNTSGAGDDSPKTRGHVLKAEETADTATEKPLLSSDANAKQANDLLASIRQYTEASKQAAAAKAQPKVEEKKAEAPKAEKKAEAPKAEAKVEEKKEAAPGFNMELTRDVLAKIAAIVLADEKGSEIVREVMAKQAGAEAAQEVISFLGNQSEEAEKQAAYAKGQADAEQFLAQLQQEALQKQAANDPQVQSYMQGQAFAEQLMQKVALAEMIKSGQIDPAMLAGMQGAPEGMPAGAEAGVPPAAPEAGAGEDISVEDVMAALQELVQSGDISPEDAQAIQAQIAGEEGGAAGAAPEAAPAPEAEDKGEAGEKPEGSEADKAEDKAEGESEDKEASAKKSTKLAAAIRTALKK